MQNNILINPLKIRKVQDIIKESYTNCWEFKKCGRNKGGANAHELGVCPAYPDHGKHCARVAGTFCDGKVQGSFAAKLADCMKCDFYNSEHYDKGYGKK